MIDKTYLESVCAAQSLPFSPELSEKLDQYAQLLVEWNEKMNLTAITEPNDIAVKHGLNVIKAATTKRNNANALLERLEKYE